MAGNFSQGDHFEVTFEAGRDGSPMTHVNGKVSFPERGGKLPKVGETWEVELAGTNPKGTVHFLRLIRRVERTVKEDLETMFVVFRSGRKGPRAFTLSDNKPAYPDRRWGTPKPQADEGWEVAVTGEDPGKTCYFVRPVRGPFPVLESKGNTHHLTGLKAAIEDGTAILGGEETMKYQSPARLYVLLDRSTYDVARHASEAKRARREEICREAGLEEYGALTRRVVDAILQGLVTVEEIGDIADGLVEARDAFHYIEERGHVFDWATDEWVK